MARSDGYALCSRSRYNPDRHGHTPTLHFVLIGGQTIMARAYGQIALDLRALPRGATICATLHDAQLECAQIIAFILIPS